jgi:hypothetical protein
MRGREHGSGAERSPRVGSRGPRGIAREARPPMSHARRVHRAGRSPHSTRGVGPDLDIKATGPAGSSLTGSLTRAGSRTARRGRSGRLNFASAPASACARLIIAPCPSPGGGATVRARTSVSTPCLSASSSVRRTTRALCSSSWKEGGACCAGRRPGGTRPCTRRESGLSLMQDHECAPSGDAARSQSPVAHASAQDGDFTTAQTAEAG